MDHETKVTYSVIAALVILLGGFALYLQPEGAEDLAKENKQVVLTTQNKKPSTLLEQPTQAASTTTSTTTTMEPQKTSTAIITTNKGTIEFSFVDTAPETVKNFTKLASSKFYDGVRFHRVIKGFMIQAGDPLSKDKANITTWGQGGPGYKFNDELKGNEQYTLGTVAMANAGPNTNGSQFFIVTANPGTGLPPSYTVFGHVTKGIETALAIQEVRTTGSPADRPLEDVVIEKVEIR